jgi:hypothetical protein
VKVEVFDSVLANLGLFPRDFVSSNKREGEGEYLPYNPPGLVQPAEVHLCTGEICSHAGALGSDVKAVPKIVDKFLKPCGI